MVAYNGIQERAVDARIKSAADRVTKAIHLWHVYTGKQINAGWNSSGPAANDECPGRTGASGWFSSGLYQCSMEDLLIARDVLPANFTSTLPASPQNSNDSRYLFMLYQCGPISDNEYAFYWSLASPSSEDSAGMETVTQTCHSQAHTSSYPYSLGMRGGRIIKL